MTSVLFSRDWYRVADLKPALRSHVEVHYHRYRGDRWYVLQDHATGQLKRLSPQAYLLVGLMNGHRSIDDIWQIAHERLGDELPSHEELLQLLGSLYQDNLVIMDVPGDAGELFQRGEKRRHSRVLAKMRSPLSVQIPIVNPEKFIDRTQHLVAPLFSPWAAAVWLLLVGFLATLSLRHWDALTGNLADKLLAADNLFLLWLVYPLIKLLHELGHAYAIKRGGGEVHEMGIMLLVFFPMPYVDAAASTAFSSRYRRMGVDAAGMIVELFIAALAMLVWVNAEEGLAKALAFNVIFIAGASTLLFNGNPLLRFDGYYLLADALEMPNLSQRSNQYWGYLFKRYLFGLRHVNSPAQDWGERFIFLFYGVLSLCYRLFISITIVLFISQKYLALGIFLAVWTVSTVWIWPLLKTLWKTGTSEEIKGQGKKPVLVMSITGLALLGLFFALPAPRTTTVEGVVQLEREYRVQAEESCFLREVHARSEEAVHENQLLLRCDSPELRATRDVLQAQLVEARAQRQGAYNDAVQLKIYDQEIERLGAEIANIEQRIQALSIHSLAAGTLILPLQSDMLGRYMRRGDVLGYILDTDAPRVRVMIPEADIDAVRNRTRTVELRAASAPAETRAVSDWVLFPSASHDIPSEVLTENGGGRIVVDPAAESLQSIENYFYAELRLADGLDRGTGKVDERVFVRFTHEPEPLGFRIYRGVRRTFLEYFDV